MKEGAGLIALAARGMHGGGPASHLRSKGRCPMWSKTAAFVLLIFCVTLPARIVANAADDTFEGKVVGVGEDKIMLMGKANADNRTFQVTAETKITRNGKAAKLADVQAGDKAMVTATGMGTKLVAKEISVAAPE
jgi:hypothetical protein